MVVVQKQLWYCGEFRNWSFLNSKATTLLESHGMTSADVLLVTFLCRKPIHNLIRC